MAKKWYRSLVEATGDPRGEVLVGGAGPGELFEFDYDQDGFNAQMLIDAGIIEEVDPPKKKAADAAGKE